MDFIWGAIQFAQVGITTNWFGLACPAHCGSPLWGTVVGIFLLGFLFGCGLTLFGILALLGFRPLAAHPSTVAPSVPIARLSRYLHEYRRF